MKVHTLKREQTIARPLKEVFAFFEKPENLAKITPPSLGFKILTPEPIEMKAGTLIDYTVSVFGIPQRWTTIITEYNPPHRFVDTQIKGPYDFWHHTHSFSETEAGILIVDEVRYTLPFGPLGELAHIFAIEGQLNQIFNYRAKVIEKIFSQQNKDN
jgi:ligand-binding SRPBCC domain-containing protein